MYLEGTYSEIYPEIGRDHDGLRRLVRQFSTPGGIPSHVSAPTPGSIHEGGELGYALVHAFGAAFDNPDLIVACTVGDGEAETAPLEGSWKGIRYLNAARDGAVLPILHLNGYKISSATVLGRSTDAEVVAFLEAHGYAASVVAGSDPVAVHVAFADVLDASYATIRNIQAAARVGEGELRPRWPAIVLRTPKGWTGPGVVDGVQVEGTFRAHQVPLSRVREDAAHLAMLESWLRSYESERLFDASGALRPELSALAPAGDLRMGARPDANPGLLVTPLELPDYGSYALEVGEHGAHRAESTRQLGRLVRDVYAANPRSFRLFCPDETASNRLDDVFAVEDRCLEAPVLPSDDHLSPDGRVMEVLSEHLCQGWLEGYTLTGRHGLFATYEAFAMVSASMTIQHAKWLQETRRLPWRSAVPSLNVLLTSTCWRNDHNGFSHQGPGLIDTVMPLSGSVVRVYLPPDANCLLSVADHCLRSRSYVNLIVIDKQPQLQYLDLAAAREHCARGASRWEWAGTEEPGSEGAEVILACAGDVPTMETLAAAWLLRRHVPELATRVVNLVDLMALAPRGEHPHGFSDDLFRDLFGDDVDVVMAFHGYPRALHQLLHGRPNAGRFHVRGFIEQGTTTTPFDMVVLNRMSRYHLAVEALDRAGGELPGAAELRAHCARMLAEHAVFIREHFEDLPEVRDWTWTAA